MRRPRFYTAQALTSDATLLLATDASRHIARTLRMRIGDTLCVFDGKGCEAAAKIVSLERDVVSIALDVVENVNRESPLHITLAIAVSRGDRMDTVVQKATELGASEIWPLLSERTGVRLDAARWARKHEHWQRIAVSACEQSGRNNLPAVAHPAGLEDVLKRCRSNGDCLRLILHPKAAAEPLPEHCQSLCLLVGPEGGFSDAEVDLATASGFQSLQLGPRILRTETAPLVALSLAQARWGDL